MKTILHFALACLCLVLAACGGGGSDTPPEARTLQLFGDSTQHEAADSYRTKYGAARVIDSSVAGTKSSDGVALLASVRGDVLLVNFGANDAVINDPTHLTPIETYKANLRLLAAAPARVIFETPNPETSDLRDLAPYAQAMREVAAETGTRLIDVYACVLASPGWQGLLRDGVHPSIPVGYDWIVTNCVAPALVGVL